MVQIPLSLSKAYDKDISFSYAVLPSSTAQGPGSGASDHNLALKGQIVIPKGQTEGFLSIPLVDDTTDEINESLVIQLVEAQEVQLSGTYRA